MEHSQTKSPAESSALHATGKPPEQDPAVKKKRWCLSQLEQLYDEALEKGNLATALAALKQLESWLAALNAPPPSHDLPLQKLSETELDAQIQRLIRENGFAETAGGKEPPPEGAI